MRGIKLAISLLLLFAYQPIWAQNLAPESPFQIILDDSERELTFGHYLETEVHLEGDFEEPIQWYYETNDLPKGLYLEDTQSSTALLFGTPKFTGRWCFVLTAEDNLGQVASEQVCLNALDNEEGYYPKFKTNEPIFVSQAGEYFYEAIGIDREELIQGGVVDGETPPGISYDFNRRSEEVEISGTARESGTFTFVAMIAYRGAGNEDTENFRQFRIVITPEDTTDDDYNQCADGYYYDYDRGHCVPVERECFGDTYYDSELNLCVPFPSPPRGHYCGSNQYYDHFLNRCVTRGVPRCPINKRWDSYYERCVPTGYYCGIGERYSHILRRCITVWRDRNCGFGEHYDYARDRCVRNRDRCRRGETWNGRRCRDNASVCGIGRRWDPRRQRCVWRDRDHRVCRDGRVWSPREQRCVRRHRPRNCRAGSHWDHRRQRCVPNTRPVPPRPRPMPPRPMTMPMPRPMPPRPMTMPMPRPMPPRPMTMPMPRPMPPRPMTMPMPRPMPPRPMTMPMPRPMPPRPMTMPMPRPMPPRPMTMPMPRPMPPRPMTMPMPRPMPPRPMTMPMPRPMPPRPMTMPMPRPMPPRPMTMPRPRPMPQPMGMPRPRPRLTDSESVRALDNLQALPPVQLDSGN